MNQWTYFDKNDPPIFLWHGGLDVQIPPETFETFISKLDKDKNRVLFSPNGQHNPNPTEFQNAYTQIFTFLEKL